MKLNQIFSFRYMLAHSLFVISLGVSNVLVGFLQFIFHLDSLPIALVVTILLFVAGNCVNERKEQDDTLQLRGQGQQKEDPQLSEVE